MAEISKSYYAIIPANIRYDNEISSNAKLLYSEITALCNEKGYCWANNEYFADLYMVSERTISRWISNLIKKCYITVEYQYKTGTKEIIKRYIKLAGNSASICEENSSLCGDKNVNTYRQNCHIGGDKNVRDNNINNNNIIINNNSPSDEEPDEDPAGIKADKYQDIVDMYSKVCTKLPKVLKLTDKRMKNIKKLLETYSLEKIEEAFRNINNSNFCTGNNDRGWKADFDFCINSDKITNALEGKYKNILTNQAYQQSKQKSVNRFHNFDSKMANMDLEEIARKKREKFGLLGREVISNE
jgi:hypothetical protein